MLAPGLDPAKPYRQWMAEEDAIYYPVLKDIEEGRRWFFFWNEMVEGSFAVTGSGTVGLDVLLAFMDIDPEVFQRTQSFGLCPPRARFPVTMPLLTASQCQQDIFDVMLRSLLRFPNRLPRWDVLPDRPFAIRIIIGQYPEARDMVPVYDWFEFGGGKDMSDGLVFRYRNDGSLRYETIGALGGYGSKPQKLYHCRIEAKGWVHRVVELMESRMDKLLSGATSWTCECCGHEHNFLE